MDSIVTDLPKEHANRRHSIVIGIRLVAGNNESRVAGASVLMALTADPKTVGMEESG